VRAVCLPISAPNQNSDFYFYFFVKPKMCRPIRYFLADNKKKRNNITRVMTAAGLPLCEPGNRLKNVCVC
jgi:hypothetical protein